MFSDYELVEFSAKLKNIRCSLGYSRAVVSKLTGINVDTIRKIEHGANVPRFETLEYLSDLYKIDLLQLLANYKNNTTLTYYFESINTYIINNNIEALLQLYQEFCIWVDSSKHSSLVNKIELMQIEKYFKVLYCRYSDPNYKIHHLIAELVSTINISIPSFSLGNWHFDNFNILELRILYSLGSFLLQSENYLLSKSILVFLLDKVDLISQSKMNANLMRVKLYALISYNHHMLDEHKEALRLAELGIHLCQKNSTMENLPLLLSRKGAALYHLKEDSYQMYLDQAVTLLEIQGNFKLASEYLKINEKYQST